MARRLTSRPPPRLWRWTGPIHLIACYCSLLAQPGLVRPWLVGQHLLGARRSRLCPCLFFIHSPDNDDETSLLQLGYVVLRRNVVVDRNTPQLLVNQLACGNLLADEEQPTKIGRQFSDLRQPA